ncbi:hypothetical protein SynTAK9802_02314 [Synechococcus sp. TAK9802]|nr:hypothetical protein SynTAK9802_02314 [Synechococcus sp. TAK9802]
MFQRTGGWVLAFEKGSAMTARETPRSRAAATRLIKSFGAAIQ